MLRAAFGDIMVLLEQELDLRKIDIKLPPHTDNIDGNHLGDNVAIGYGINDLGNINYIPESLIAQKLRNGLESNVNNDVKYLEIINAFKSIYHKYIDDDCAIYMINISSANRNKLKYLFDCKYYKYQMKQRQNKHNKTKSLSSSLSFAISNKMNQNLAIGNLSQSVNNVSVTDDVNNNASIMNSSCNNSATNDNNNCNINELSFINQELKTRILQIHGQSNNNMTVQEAQDNLTSWLLARIFIVMKPAILEIGNLMRDSFSRFIVKQDKNDPMVC